MTSTRLNLTLLPDRFAICRLEPDAPFPQWAMQSAFCSLTRTPDELSLVVPHECVPEGIRSERDWRAIQVQGPLDFALTGILASLCAPLAEAGVSVFALSTFDTDYILVRETQWESALTTLHRHHNLRHILDEASNLPSPPSL